MSGVYFDQETLAIYSKLTDAEIKLNFEYWLTELSNAMKFDVDDGIPLHPKVLCKGELEFWRTLINKRFLNVGSMSISVPLSYNELVECKLHWRHILTLNCSVYSPTMAQTELDKWTRIVENNPIMIDESGC